jgi:hypothetical protein
LRYVTSRSKSSVSRTVALAQHLAHRSVEAGGARQVITTAAQEQIAHRRHPSIAPVGEDRRQAADVLPPVTQRWPCQALQTLGRVGIRVTEIGVSDDGTTGQQFEGRLKQIEGGEMALHGGAGVVSPAIELGQRQRQTAGQGVVEGEIVHWAGF